MDPRQRRLDTEIPQRLRKFLSGGSRISQRENVPTPEGGANLLFSQSFPENCMKMKKFWDNVPLIYMFCVCFYFNIRLLNILFQVDQFQPVPNGEKVSRTVTFPTNIVWLLKIDQGNIGSTTMAVINSIPSCGSLRENDVN